MCVNQRNTDPVVVEDRAAAAPIDVDLVQDGLDGDVVLDDPVGPGLGGDVGGPGQRQPVLGVARVVVVQVLEDHLLVLVHQPGLDQVVQRREALLDRRRHHRHRHGERQAGVADDGPPYDFGVFLLQHFSEDNRIILLLFLHFNLKLIDK